MVLPRKIFQGLGLGLGARVLGLGLGTRVLSLGLGLGKKVLFTRLHNIQRIVEYSNITTLVNSIESLQSVQHASLYYYLITKYRLQFSHKQVVSGVQISNEQSG